VVVDEVGGNGESGIATVDPVHQRPVDYTQEFINLGYLPSDSFQKGYNVPDKDLMDSFTDVVMINSFRGDDKGDFILVQDRTDDGSQVDKLITYKDAKEEAGQAVERWIASAKAMMGEKQPRLWMSLMTLTWGDNGVSSGETAVFNDAAVRTAFVADVVAFAKDHGFYGIDLDWEAAKTAEDWQAYNALAGDLIAAAHEAGLKTSTAQSMWWPNVDKEVLRSFDRVGIMAYDSYGTDANHSAFMQAGVDAIELFHNEYGIPREKLVLGLPWYGNQLTENGGDIDWNKPQVGWKDIYRDLLKASEDQETIDPGLNRFTKRNTDYTFNGPNMIRSKVVLAAKNKLGGVFCWAAHADVEYANPYSLGRATAETIDEYVLVR
jgi:GH18 family chitinase